jgi:hypothetical protein
LKGPAEDGRLWRPPAGRAPAKPLAGDPISIAALLDVVSISGEQSYAGLQDQLMETLDEQAEASS